MLASLSLIALASMAAARPIFQMDAMLASVTQAVSLPNTTQTDNATWYLQNGQAGACGLYSADTDKVVGLPLAFYNDTGSVSTYCGAYVVIVNPSNNQTVTSRVADASGSPGLFSMSVASWRAVDGDAGDFTTVQWRFANKTETAAAKLALDQPAASSSAAGVTAVLVATSVQAAAAETTPTSTYEAPAAKYTPTSTYEAPATTWTPEPTTTWKPTTTSIYQQATKAASSSGSYSGTATWFTQNGVAGNCGNVNSDSAYIIALESSMYANGAHCGQSVTIWGNGGSIQATVADSCPSCVSSGSIDLSVAAFQALASLGAGVFPVTWSFN